MSVWRERDLVDHRLQSVPADTCPVLFSSNRLAKASGQSQSLEDRATEVLGVNSALPVQVTVRVCVTGLLLLSGTSCFVCVLISTFYRMLCSFEFKTEL